jgi:O-antigen/teichoic acid export membrane protein
MTFEKLLQQSLLWRGFYFFTVLLVNVFLGRYLQAEGSGWIYYVSNIFSLVVLVSSLSMENAYTFFASGKLISDHKLAWLSVLWSVLCAGVILGGMWCYFNVVQKKTYISQQAYMGYAVAYVCGILLTNFFTVLFYARKNFLLPNLLMGGMNLLLIAGIVLLHRHQAQRITDAYFFMFLLQGLVLALVYMGIFKSFTSPALPNLREFKSLLRYAMVALAGNLIFFLVYRIDYWFVKHNPQSCSLQDLGNYIQASKLGQFMMVIPQILASAIFPQTASGQLRAEVNKSILVLLRIFLQVFAVIALLTLLAGNQLIMLVFGSSFNNVATPLLLLIPGIAAIAVLTLLSAYFSGKGKVRVNVEGAALALVIVVAGDMLLIPHYGIIGAALVSTLGYLANTLYALWHFYKDYQLTMKDILAFSRADWQWLLKMLTNKPQD